MKTPILNISEDQNIITHESGLITQFSSDEIACGKCCYDAKESTCISIGIPCVEFKRDDFMNGVFIIKEP